MEIVKTGSLQEIKKAMGNTIQRSTALFDAVKWDRIDVVEMLLDDGISANERNSNGSTALYYTKSQEVAKLLLDRGANVSVTNNDGYTPLHYVRSPKVVKFLLDHGADVYAVGRHGDTVLHHADYEYLEDDIYGIMRIDNRIIDNTVETYAVDNVKSIIERCAHEAEVRGESAVDAVRAYVNTKTKYGNTPLLTVRNPVILKIFLENGADVNAVGVYDRTVLLGRCAHDINIVKVLLDHNADETTTDDCGRTVLHNIDDPDIIKMILEYHARKSEDKGIPAKEALRKYVNAVDDCGCTPLHFVEDHRTAKLFIDHGADVNICNNEGCTPLHENSILEILDLLLDNGADVNHTDNVGSTPLHKAFTPELVKYLVDHGANVNAVDKDGHTPLHCTKDPDIVDMLIRCGADNADGHKIPVH